MNEEEQVLIHCLYFTASRFARNITKLAERTFDFGNLAPSYFYMIMIVKFHPEITQKELCHKLSIAPSTSTRFIDKLESLKLVTRKMSGKQTYISLTEEGEKVYHQFRNSLKDLFAGYSQILGSEFSLDLSKMLHEASNKLEEEL
ncbi:DNA-binding transcriptional regulator, MarR family [Paenibacillus sophorae]|uniref:DNA-binding transcriptional regulator, MarR family n=1 Tax=Paenibacillus sophorae TaxID=1333845 RepID=A0A1H8IZZ0_9BACL|nr:MarR family transcriptional regulator [Paenibacillus sophorae]QWU16154.1 MarR family transcriptional regulator [Paenibacillus sophorae]SEN74062.1 DNA-binding transcriptional regulator, MarR family [Paenibacillus sophorae]